MTKIPKKWVGRATLAALIILSAVKLLIGSCNLLLCGAFVAVIVTYAILSDYGRA